MSSRSLFQAALALCLAASFSSCQKNGGPAAPAAPLADKGRSAYLANCIACHNADPRKDGPIGPAIAGSSLDLVRARVMKAEYPPGYQPKRQSHAMAPLPHLESQLEALHAFLNAP